MASEAKLLYSKSVYEAKISEFEDYINRLNEHYETLSDLQGRVQSFWEDSQAQEYYRQIDTTKAAVKNATEQTQSMLTQYKSVVEQMTGQINATEHNLENVDRIINTLDIAL